MQLTETTTSLRSTHKTNEQVGAAQRRILKENVSTAQIQRPAFIISVHNVHICIYVVWRRKCGKKSIFSQPVTKVFLRPTYILGFGAALELPARQTLAVALLSHVVLADGRLQLRGVFRTVEAVRGRQHVVTVDQGPAAEEGLSLPQNDREGEALKLNIFGTVVKLVCKYLVVMFSGGTNSEDLVQCDISLARGARI